MRTTSPVKETRSKQINRLVLPVVERPQDSNSTLALALGLPLFFIKS